jgi:hypothetical protein
MSPFPHAFCEDSKTDLFPPMLTNRFDELGKFQNLGKTEGIAVCWASMVNYGTAICGPICARDPGLTDLVCQRESGRSLDIEVLGAMCSLQWFAIMCSGIRLITARAHARSKLVMMPLMHLCKVINWQRPGILSISVSPLDFSICSV